MSSLSPFPALHHIALTVTDPAASRAWYGDVLGSDPVLDEDVAARPDHHKGFRHILFALPSGTFLGPHSHADTDRRHTFDELRPGLDHVGFGLSFRDPDRIALEFWAARS